MSIGIRIATQEDLAAIGEIVLGAYGVYIQSIGVRPAPMDCDYAQIVSEGHLYVADMQGTVGLIVLIQKPDHLFIENVAVHPRHQHLGVGRALLAFAECMARRRGLLLVRLYTNAAMSSNLALYARLGYREEDRRTEGAFERVFLEKRLTASP